MAIPEDRMSTTVVETPWVSPDDRTRDLTEDYEQGPVALNDTSEGLDYQAWHLTYNIAGSELVVTPETVGSPSTVLSGLPTLDQCSLAFDQNGHVTISYSVLGGASYLYWYDTVAGDWVTTVLPSAVFCPTLTLDDKRNFASSYNDILLWWTEQQPDESYKLYRAQQRDRFDPLVPKEMATGVYPYIYKLGMNSGLRIQLGLSDRIL